MQAFDEIEGIWKTTTASEEDVAALDQIRQQAFLAASRASGQHEIASYVSDDFELIGKALVLGVDIAFVSSLYQSYCNNQIPEQVD